MSVHAEKRFLTNDGSGFNATEVAKTLYKIPTLLTTWTRCGKAKCRCSSGHLHGPYHALHWRDGPIQRRLYVRRSDVPAVRAILGARREQRRAERQVLAQSMQNWRELGQWIEDVETRLRAELEPS